jgi:hypothetical protein
MTKVRTERTKVLQENLPRPLSYCQQSRTRRYAGMLQARSESAFMLAVCCSSRADSNKSGIDKSTGQQVDSSYAHMIDSGRCSSSLHLLNPLLNPCHRRPVRHQVNRARGCRCRHCRRGFGCWSPPDGLTDQWWSFPRLSAVGRCLQTFVRRLKAGRHSGLWRPGRRLHGPRRGRLGRRRRRGAARA